MLNSTSDAKESEFRFCEFLQKVLNGNEPVEALLEHIEYKRRVPKICGGFAYNVADAEELFNDVSLKVWLKVRLQFHLDDSLSYGGFFAWVRTIARTTFSDGLKPTVPIVKKPVEDLPVADPNVDIEGELLRREREEQAQKLIDEFKRHVATLPRKVQLAITLYILKGCSLRRTAQVLNRVGIKCSHVAVRGWVREGLRTYFPNIDPRVFFPARKAPSRSGSSSARTRPS